MLLKQYIIIGYYYYNSPAQDYTTNLDNHSNHNIDSPGFKPFTVILKVTNHNYSVGNGGVLC